MSQNEKLIFVNGQKKLIFENDQELLIFVNGQRKLIFDEIQEVIVVGIFDSTFDSTFE